MKNLWQEFRAFAFKGNLFDLAVAVVIGTAFTGVVNALAKNVIMPAVSYIVPAEAEYRTWKLGRVEVGTFLGELLNFAVIAAVLFVVIVKILGGLVRSAAPPSASAPATRECPFCLSLIPARATRCAHCTSEVAPVA